MVKLFAEGFCYLYTEGSINRKNMGTIKNGEEGYVE